MLFILLLTSFVVFPRRSYDASIMNCRPHNALRATCLIHACPSHVSSARRPRSGQTKRNSTSVARPMCELVGIFSLVEHLAVFARGGQVATDGTYTTLPGTLDRVLNISIQDEGPCTQRRALTSHDCGVLMFKSISTLYPLCLRFSLAWRRRMSEGTESSAVDR